MKTLYTSSPLQNRRKNFPLSRNPASNSSLFGVTFGYRTPPKLAQRNALRKQTYSIEHAPASAVIDNAEDAYIPQLFNKSSEELFGLSYAKICKIRSTIRSKNIDEEINSVLSVLDEEKEKIRERILKLKETNQYYKNLYEGSTKPAQTKMIAVSTEPVIFESKHTQTAPESQEHLAKQVLQNNINQEKIEEVYGKLTGMLIDMSIDPLQILPSITPPPPIPEKAYKNLTPAQVIRIQKFFMRKLAEKLPK